jgi:hypothetical protein
VIFRRYFAPRLTVASSYQENLRKRLNSIPVSNPPSPWALVGTASIGGLTEVGFAGSADDLLVVSSQGRGLFDCLTGERIARDQDEVFPNPDETGLTCPGIGRRSAEVIRMAGLHGGGLLLGTRDGWVLHVIQLPWPIHYVFLTSDFCDVTDDSGHITKICNDEPCTFRAAGFSSTGRSFVVATSGEVRIYARAG